MFQQVAVGPTMARRAVALLAGKTAAIMLSMASAAIIPRQLGPRGMGFYSYLYSSVFTLVCFLDAGGSMLLRRYVPELLSRARTQVLPLFVASLRAKLVVFAVLAAATPLAPDRLMYTLAVGAAAAASLLESFQTLLYAGGSIVAYSSVNAVVTALRIALLVGLAPSLQRLGIALSLVLSSVVAVAVFARPAMRLVPPSQEPLSQSYWRFLRFGLVSYGADLAFVLSNRIALIMCRHTVDDMAEIGYLGVAFMIFLLARQLAFFIGETSIPSLVHYHATGNTPEFARTMTHVWRYTSIVVFAIAMLIVCYVEPLIVAVVGAAFRPTATLTILLIPAFIATTLTLCVRIALFAREKSIRLMAAHGGALAILIGLMATLWAGGRSVSSRSAAVVFSISSVAGFLFMAFRAGMEIPFSKALLAILRPLAAAGAVCTATRVLPLRGPWSLVCSPLAVLAYVAVLLVVRGLEWRDWHRLKSLLGRDTVEDALAQS